MTYREYYDELVELIYKIPIQNDGWGIFLAKLNQVMDSSAIHVIGMDLKYNAFSYSRAISLNTEEESASIEVNYIQNYIKNDPRWVDVLNKQQTGWYQCHHFIDDATMESSEVYKNILEPNQIRYSAVHELIQDDRLCVIIGINTSKQRAPLNQDELDFLDQLVVHLKRIAVIQRYIFEFSSKAIIGYSLIDKLSQPIILINLDCKVVHLNTSAQQLIQKTKVVNICDDQLLLPQPFQQKLASNLQNIECLFRQKSDQLHDVIKDGCIKLDDGNGGKIYIFATLLISEHELKTFGIRPTVMLTIYHPKYSPTINSHLLHTAFNLTPAESRVAILLLEGFVAKEISIKNNVSIDTVRKQIKEILRKTDTNRQSDLVKLLLSMPKYFNEILTA